MTLDEVKKKVLEIEEKKGDNEIAHIEEDELHHAVLREVASGNPESQKMAEEALKTLDIYFSRWHA